MSQRSPSNRSSGLESLKLKKFPRRNREISISDTDISESYERGIACWDDQMLSDAPQNDRESGSAVQITTAPQLLIKQATMKRVICILNP